MATEPVKKRLLVDENRASDGIWTTDDISDGWTYHGVRGLDLPQWLIHKIVFWCYWHEGFFPYYDPLSNSMLPGEPCNEEHFRAYKISIAYDLQITLGDGYEIYYLDENDEYVKIELPFDPSKNKSWSNDP